MSCVPPRATHMRVTLACLLRGARCAAHLQQHRKPGPAAEGRVGAAAGAAVRVGAHVAAVQVRERLGDEALERACGRRTPAAAHC